MKGRVRYEDVQQTWLYHDPRRAASCCAAASSHCDRRYRSVVKDSIAGRINPDPQAGDQSNLFVVTPHGEPVL